MKRIVVAYGNAIKKLKNTEESSQDVTPPILSRQNTEVILDDAQQGLTPIECTEVILDDEAQPTAYNNLDELVASMNGPSCPAHFNVSLVGDDFLYENQPIKLMDALANNKNKIKHLEFGNIALNASYGDHVFAVCKDFPQLTLDVWKLFVAANQQAIMDLEDKFTSLNEIMSEDQPKEKSLPTRTTKFVNKRKSDITKACTI